VSPAAALTGEHGAVVAVLLLLAAVAAVLARSGRLRGRVRTGAVVTTVVLVVLAVVLPRPATGLAVVLVLAVAAVGGGPLVEAVLRWAGDPGDPGDPARAGARITEPAAGVLRGGAVIGVLERLAVAGLLLAGMPDGVAVVVAVKALGRYPELRAVGASERFIIGTLVSLLWAGAVVAVVAAGEGSALLG
jgi:hypothetical protein